MSFYEIGNARYPEQAEQMRRLEAAGVCLFCPGAAVDPDGPEVVLAERDWVVRWNTYPYAGSRLHLLLLPRRHVSDLLDLTDEELAGFWPVCRELRRRFDLEFYGLAARCGDCARTSGTIEHVHVHLLVGDVEDPEHTPIRVKLSSRPAPPPAADPPPPPSG